MSEASPESIEGTLEQMLYVSEASGYAVAILEMADVGAGSVGRRRITIVGDLGELEIGAGLKLSGRFEKHPRYGEQFRVVDFETLKPAGVAALERYLAGEIKGVGPALARRIVTYFGEALPVVLETTPERLHEVRGLPRLVAQRIAAAWRDSSGLRELTVFLRGHGIGAGHARRIHKIYGRESLATVSADPYLLARTVAGIGFRTADRVAEKLGIPRNSTQRARAAILYLLERMAEEGHVFAPVSHLQGQFETTLEMDAGLARAALEELVQSGEVCVERTGEDDAVYLARLHEAEVVAADRLHVLAAGRSLGEAVIARALEAAVRTSSEFELTPEQRQALTFALKSRVAVITGGPGTGKTTLLRTLLAALDAAGLKPTLAAPTGRAARRLADACGRDARTIHRLLEYSPETQTFIRTENFPLRTNYLVIDEASMMDVELAASVVRALMPNSSILLVGDRDQLPSVGPGSVLKDVIASGLAPVAELREVFRQARQSLIVANAHRLNRGEMPQTTNDPESDFFFFERNAPEDVAATIKQLVQQRLVGRFGIRDAREIQVLTPMNRGPLGVHALNRELQELLNPRGREIRAGDRRFREGDRVIQLRNNYEKLVFNGAIGRVVSVDSERGRVGVVFDEGHAEYDLAGLDELGLAYAISIHKSQGSQYPAVVIPIHQTHYLMLRRNLLYTAITRAERVCVLVGTRSALAQAVRNEDERRRFSRLAERLRID
ncbi:MAG TPA: ATP-dependent RecD-like DNA helicase [Candidatus Binataceae bacterium]|nr:ATP-dependent RecD-like DNA helicase [Candidatus Binataceae bacterium]